MKRQVIETFLNLSGVVGIALMDDGRSRPYFYGIDTVLNSQQLEPLTKGIQQVVSTTPHDFESFTFHFTCNDIHLYRLMNGTILLVLTTPELDREVYANLLPQLQQVLQDDAQNAIANFRLLAGSSTLTNPDYWQPETQAVPAYPAQPNAPVTITWELTLAALNCLSDATAHYLGKIVVANTWRSTRPDDDALKALNLNRNGHFALADAASPPKPDALISDDTYAALKPWVDAFSTR